MRKIRGFIVGPVLLFVVLVFLVVAAMAYMNTSSTNFSVDEQRSKMQATLLKNQASTLKQEFNSAVASGLDPKSITLDAGSSGLYNPSAGFAIKQNIPEASCAVTKCAWQVSTDYKISEIIGAGVVSRVSETEGCVKKDDTFTYYSLAKISTPKDIIFVLPGVTASICEQLIKADESTFSANGTGAAVPATTAVFVPGEPQRILFGACLTCDAYCVSACNSTPNCGAFQRGNIYRDDWASTFSGNDVFRCQCIVEGFFGPSSSRNLNGPGIYAAGGCP